MALTHKVQDLEATRAEKNNAYSSALAVKIELRGVQRRYSLHSLSIAVSEANHYTAQQSNERDTTSSKR